MEFPVKTPRRSELSSSLQSITDVILAQAQPQANPVIVHTIGIPGAGKSSFVRSLSDQMIDIAHTVVAFDRIMMAIPEYQQEAKERPEQAFQRHELAARAAGYFLVKNLISNRANILFDHSGAFPEHPDLLRFAQEHGYKVVLVRITAAMDSVKERIVERQRIEGRCTPLDYVDARAGIINELLRSYQSVADSYTEIDNKNSPEAKRKLFFNDAAQATKEIILHISSAL